MFPIALTLWNGSIILKNFECYKSSTKFPTFRSFEYRKIIITEPTLIKEIQEQLYEWLAEVSVWNVRNDLNLYITLGRIENSFILIKKNTW